MPFGRILRRISRVVLPIAGAAVGSLVGMPQLGAAAGSSIGAALNGGNLRQSLLSGAGTYVGSSIGSSLGSNLGTVGQAAGNAGINLGSSVAGDSIGAQIGNFIGNTAPGLATTLGSTSIGGALGAYAGNSIADAYSGMDMVGRTSPATQQGPAAFSPKQEAQQGQPASISGLGALTGDQQATNLATQGVYGQGNGPAEQSYYLNLLNRRLVDEGGRVNENAQVAPIEQSYLQRLGINSSGNSSNLLEAINRWRQQQQTQAA